MKSSKDTARRAEIVLSFENDGGLESDDAELGSFHFL
jgi:hypothetical protein